MVLVQVRKNNVDQALRVLKKKLQKEGVFREMKENRYFEKPSAKRSRKKAEGTKRVRKNMLKKYWLFATSMIIISLITVFSFYNVLTPEKKLPIYQPSMVKFQLVDSTIQHVKRFHKIDDFKLINQNNDTITNEIYDGKIYVADFFFTTCPGICPIMKENMIDIQKEFVNDDQVLLLSHTVTPEIDSVEILKDYSIDNGIIDSKWNLVTGDKKQIYNLARKSYLVAEDIESDIKYDMIHTENFVLVDPNRRIRGFYDGTSSESMERLIEDIYILKKEF